MGDFAPGRWWLHDSYFAVAQLPGNSSYQEITQACWTQFEPIIRQYPDHWLWVINIGGTGLPSRIAKYPFYANRSTQFDLEIESQERPEKAKILRRTNTRTRPKAKGARVKSDRPEFSVSSRFSAVASYEATARRDIFPRCNSSR